MGANWADPFVYLISCMYKRDVTTVAPIDFNRQVFCCLSSTNWAYRIIGFYITVFAPHKKTSFPGSRRIFYQKYCPIKRTQSLKSTMSSTLHSSAAQIFRNTSVETSPFLPILAITFVERPAISRRSFFFRFLSISSFQSLL